MNPMIVIVIVLAVLMVVGFGGVWLKDRNRTQEQAVDAERLDP